MNFERYIDKAKLEASKLPPERGQYRTVCFALNNRGRVISIGNNSYTKSHRKQYMFAKAANHKEKQYLHAEIHALIKAQLRNGRSRKIDSIFVLRFQRDGSLGLAKPCSVCSLAIKSAKIRKVFYSTDSGIEMQYTTGDMVKW